MSELNWAGTVEYGARQTHTVGSIEEAQQLIAGSRRVRALGTRHSFNRVADSTGGDLVSLVNVPTDIRLGDDGTVSVGAGTTYGVLALWLERHGLALHNMGSLPHISVAGAIATATHGSGDSNGNLSSAVRALDVIGADGTIATIAQGDPDFAGSVVALGALGVTARVTLAVEPSFRVRQDVYADLDWSTALAEFDAVSARGYSVSLFTRWLGDTVPRVWVKSRLEPNSDGEMPERLFGATLVREPQGAPGSEHNDGTTLQGGVPGPWLERLPHFRLDATPSNGDEIQSEYLVARSDAAEALSALRAIGDRIAPALLMSELRTVAADDLWLSTAYRRDSLCIHFTWRNAPAEVAAVLPFIEAALAPFFPRAHWGKVFAMSPAQAAAGYERLAEFVDLVRRRDPEGMFGNEFVDEVVASVSS